jgi:hypothetical protein
MAAKQPAEEMEGFFDARAREYDEQMREPIRCFQSFHGGIAELHPGRGIGHG